MDFLATFVAYLIGSMPMGYIFVKLFKRQDITKVGSGRTGGTNAMRAGGVWVGILTAVFDILKGFLSVSIARMLVPASVWIQVAAGVAAVIGHNWSIWIYFLTKKFAAGAGTGPNVGAAMVFWPGVLWVGIPIILIFVFVVGYASVASIATAIALVIVFAVRAVILGDPWQYIIYSGLTAMMVIIALLPNLKRLIEGTERRVGLFAKRKQPYSSSSSSSSS
ncbi:MAG: glycerol-3-phosphate acyltransferase [Anaerolineales bacterium]|nr:glycerol-3-phosphate acyltransferase [Anaerolineales bacterium]